MKKEEIKQIKCSSCGDVINIPEGKKEIFCINCGKKINIDDIDKESNDNLKEDINSFDDSKKSDNKKPKHHIIIIIISIIILLLSTRCLVVAFRVKAFLRAFVCLIQIILFLYTLLACFNVIPDKFRKWYRTAFIIGLILIIPIINIPNPDLYDKKEKLNLKDTELGEYLPGFKEPYGRITSDTSDNLAIDLYRINKKEYKAYIEKVKKAGYDIDNEESENSYSAFNAEGYYIDLDFFDYEDDKDDNLDIDLSAPMKLAKIEWPNLGPASLLPKTKSLLGKIEINNSNQFIVYIGNTNLAEYNNYVNECIKFGYNINFTKNLKDYKAKNSNGNILCLEYKGYNIIRIEIEKENKKESEEEIENEEPDIKEENTPNNNSTGLRPEFKNAMDSYEKVMNEYVEFMKKYESSPNDIGLLTEYTKYLEKYAKAVEDFGKWDYDNMNAAEGKYYLEVQTRVLNKLSEIE